MKTAIKYLAIFCLLFLASGCATRVGASHKLPNYDVKFKELAVVYSQGNFRHEGLVKKLERYNFQKMDEYVAKAAPQTFPNYGISAFVYKRTPDSIPSPKEKQILFISAVKVEAKGHNGVVSSGPSADPVKVKYEVNIFDSLINKEVWKAEFYIVAGGLLYSAFDEEKAAAFLNDILAKLEADGLAQKTVATLK